MFLRSSNMNSHTFTYILHRLWNITILQCDQLPVGLIAQLAEHCTGIAEFMGAISSPNLGVLGPISLQRSV